MYRKKKIVKYLLLPMRLLDQFCLIKTRLLLDRFVRTIDRINQVGELLGARVCFLDMFPSHHQFSWPTIEQLSLHRPVILLVLQKDHPAYRNRAKPKNVHVFLLEKGWVAFALNWLRIPYLVTPASHLHPSAVRADLRVVHTFHSLVSMHAVYGDDAFDTYTDFFACGPHHVSEIEAIKKARGLEAAKIFDIGYPKLDQLAQGYRNTPKVARPQQTVLIAPSWHTGNLLAEHGEELCDRITALGYSVIIRPHPHFYERDHATMSKLRSKVSRSQGRIKIENPDTEFASFFLSDLMISDWSGVAFEFAFATGRPVVFVDTPRKINSVELAALNLPVMEREARSQVGVVVSGTEGISDGIRDAFARSPVEWIERISEARKNYVFNFGMSAAEGSRILEMLSSDVAMLPPSEIPTERLIQLLKHYS